MRLIVQSSPQRTSAVRLLPLLGSLAVAVVVTCISWSQSALRLGADETPVTHDQPARDFMGQEFCAEPAAMMDKEVMRHWGCKLFRDACLDEGRILLHNGQRTPGHPNWTDTPLFRLAAIPDIVLPGYPEPLGTAHYHPVRILYDIRAPTYLDPPDVWRPARFNNCTVPLIFFPMYLSIYGDFFVGRLASLFRIGDAGAINRSHVLFAPETNGMESPNFYQTHLEPFSQHPVETVASLSSRENIQLGRSRCYRQLLLCNLSWYHGPKHVGRKIVEYYESKHPEQFVRVNDTVFRVAFFNRTGGTRVLLNQGEVLQQCKDWQLPTGSNFTKVDCYLIDDFGPDNLVKSLAELQRVNALVAMHGSGMTNAFFLPDGAAVIELMCHNFCGEWPNFYYRWPMEADTHVRSGFFRIRADSDHCYPGLFERSKRGASWAYARDQDIRVTFSALAQALTKIALGEIDSPRSTVANRTFSMMKPHNVAKCP